MDSLRGQLAVGVQWDTEVSSVDSGEQRVCQVYCAAVPVAYAPGTTTDQWEPLARLVLRGCYESTLLVAALKAVERGAREKVYLTLVGGGVFGNDEQWIVDAIKDSITSLESKFDRRLPIDIIIMAAPRLLAMLFASSASCSDDLVDGRHLGAGSKWFEDTFGFSERAGGSNMHATVHRNVELHKRTDGVLELRSKPLGKRYEVGRFDTPSLAELRSATSKNRPPEIPGVRPPHKEITIQNIVADVRDLHRDPANDGAVFQVASQFNCLEMPGMNTTPEEGITNYIHDHTQGPACALECAPGTLFRNYFVKVMNNGTAGVIDVCDVKSGAGLGQYDKKQLDGLQGLGEALDNRRNRYWTMKNGGSVADLKKRLEGLSKSTIDELTTKITVGVQKDTQVSSVSDRVQKVTQVYCSALPVGYFPNTSSADWEPFARLVLNSLYESTLLVAEREAQRRGRTKVFLTHVGGGVFGNDQKWIVDAIEKAVWSVFLRGNSGKLDVYIVNYNSVPRIYEELVDRLILSLQPRFRIPSVGDSLNLWSNTRGKALQESYDHFIQRPEAFPQHVAALHPLITSVREERERLGYPQEGLKADRECLTLQFRVVFAVASNRTGKDCSHVRVASTKQTCLQEFYQLITTAAKMKLKHRQMVEDPIIRWVLREREENLVIIPLEALAPGEALLRAPPFKVLAPQRAKHWTNLIREVMSSGRPPSL
ncbi:hypothetical protein FOZ61_008883 [Perkinsus olseni]|uniref:Uncharacterized protein n=1 Tax=Perkinsus olseni TaxID=32597 RepID=A0A7J6M627_PEROL|nr:hypothetical protein FOZ61_008883 [Perkinsus olseni]KAF4673147.1 hypothetical protein FOL46_007745 [Perkinsus olseni]